MSKKSGFKVKDKYQGLTHPCSKNVLSKVAIQENPSVAVEFYVEHPNGKSLFDQVPKNIKDLVKKYGEDKAKAEKEAAEHAKKVLKGDKDAQTLENEIAEKKGGE